MAGSEMVLTGLILFIFFTRKQASLFQNQLSVMIFGRFFVMIFDGRKSK